MFFKRLFLKIVAVHSFWLSLGLGLSLLVSPVHAVSKQIDVQLANVYEQQAIRAYLVSEKYDGVRAIWKNQKLQTRTGKPIFAPTWFTKNLPNMWLDGELWYERGNFEYVVSTVTKNTPVDSQWQQIKYMVFDAPDHALVFSERVAIYTDTLLALQLAHVHPVKQFSLRSNDKLTQMLEHYTDNGAEGLMLHKADALFSHGRSDNLLKLKRYMDAEARVIRHIRGKGKYQNAMGAILVEYIDKQGKSISFKIGTGFSDKERAVPPPIGSVITFKYHGFTNRGLPRFASFLRVHN